MPIDPKWADPDCPNRTIRGLETREKWFPSKHKWHDPDPCILIRLSTLYEIIRRSTLVGLEVSKKIIEASEDKKQIRDPTIQAVKDAEQIRDQNIRVAETIRGPLQI